ncbi:MAG: betaine-aldehyde dehydrogenase [Acidobacteria bacterium]|nr:betaine-aldehyde dehydrogenase [Acidobacteriota bacterium]
MKLVNAHTTLPTQRLYIDGEYVDATSGETFQTINPATNRVICDVQQAGDEDVDRAVITARKGFLHWSRTPPVERSRTLMRVASILRERNLEFAYLETLDTDRPLSETTTDDVIYASRILEYYAGVAQTLRGDHYDLAPDNFAIVRREPLGVCAGIGAWNYSLGIAVMKAAPALVCGNSMIFKPAELSPLTALKLAEVFTEAGLPPGVFNVVQGDGRTGQLLSRHPGISKISFTGEGGTGRKVMVDAAPTLKHVTLELGGKSPLIVFADADFDSAMNAALVGNFFSAGELCCTGTRVFVERPIYDRFVAGLGPRVTAMRVGDPFDMETQVGPLISKAHMEKVLGYIEMASASAATHVVGGRRPDSPELQDGNYVTPAIFCDCADDMQFVRDEIFGPVMSVMVFDEENEVLRRANDTVYGLAGGVFTSDFARAHRVAIALEAGTVWINGYGSGPPSLPFGGVKQSGLGRENGLATLDAYTQTKTINASMSAMERYY